MSQAELLAAAAYVHHRAAWDTSWSSMTIPVGGELPAAGKWRILSCSPVIRHPFTGAITGFGARVHFFSHN